MISIDYEKLQNPELIEEFIRLNNYDDLCILFDSLINKKFDYKDILDANLIIEMTILLKISRKYKYKKQEVKNLIEMVLAKRIDIKFLLAEVYIDFLDTKKEINRFIDSFLYGISEINDKISCINTLEYLMERKKISKKDYKLHIAMLSLDISYSLDSLDGHTYIQKSIKIFKEMNKKNLLHKAMIRQQEISSKIQEQMHPISIKLPSEIKLFDVGEEKVREIFLPIKDEIDFLYLMCSNMVFKLNDKFVDYFSVFLSEDDFVIKKKNTFIDLINRTTFSGNKVVKEVSTEHSVKMIVRRLHIMKKITPIIEILKQGKIDKFKFVELLMKSEFILDEDYSQIKLLLELFFENNIIQFLYCVIPNIEKILRNILVVNNLPEYTTRNDNPNYHITRNLTETLNAIQENSIMSDEFVESLRQKFNDENFENYRNRLSHRLDNELFSDEVANDIFMIFVNILFYNLTDKNEVIVLGTEAEVDEIMKKIESDNRNNTNIQ